MSLFSQEAVNIIAAVSGIATIAGFFLAVITLLIWRKQQKYSHILNAIMDLEDKYELLMHAYFETYNWFFQRLKLAYQVDGKSEHYKVQVSEKIKNDFLELKQNDKLPLIEKDYQLAYLRANRFNISLNSYEAIKYAALKDFFQKNHVGLNRKMFSSDILVEQEMNRYAKELSELKAKGIEQFKAIRGSM